MARRRAVGVVAPTRFAAAFVFRLLKAVAILALVLVIVLGGVAAFLTYRIVTTQNSAEIVTPQTSFQTNYMNLSFTDRAGAEHEGWLLVGLKGAPVVILCHGYDSNRSELLSLGTVLRQNHFNVYLFNFAGPGTQGRSDLGVREIDTVLTVIEKLTKETGINPKRVGLFGTTTGGFAALAAAQQSPLVKAIVLDTIYDDPRQMFEAQIEQLLGGSSFLFRILAVAEFRLVTLGSKAPRIREDLSKLENVPKLFISGRDTPLLAEATEKLYTLAPQPKRLLVLEHSQSAQASGAEKKEYENQILAFFLHSLPLRAD